MIREPVLPPERSDCHPSKVVVCIPTNVIMDCAILDAYGWHDIPTNCDFFLDYEIDEETWGKKKRLGATAGPTISMIGYLALLLDLNQKRAEEERLAGLTPSKKGREKKKKLPNRC